MKITMTRTPRTKRHFFRSLWQAILRFDEALNYNSRDDLARRIAELERQRG
jgi:hypothetical protein